MCFLCVFEKKAFIVYRDIYKAVKILAESESSKALKYEIAKFAEDNIRAFTIKQRVQISELTGFELNEEFRTEVIVIDEEGCCGGFSSGFFFVSHQ